MWQRKYRIPSENPSEYLAQLNSWSIKSKFPLVSLFQVGSFPLSPTWRKDLTPMAVITNKEFPWPELFAVAMNSVGSSFNRNPPDPRMYSSTDQALRLDLGFFADTLAAESYYNERNFNMVQLKTMLKRRIASSGGHPGITGPKGVLIKRVKDGDNATAIIFFRNIVATQQVYIESLLQEPFHAGLMRTKEMARVGDAVLTLETLRDLSVGISISLRLMTFVFELLQQRESAMAAHYNHVNGGEDGDNPFVPILFLHSGNNIAQDERLERPYHSVYWVEFVGINWCLYIFNKTEKTIQYIFPPLFNSNLTDAEAKLVYPLLFTTSDLLTNNLIDRAGEPPQNVVLRSYPIYITGDIEDRDSGVAVFASLSFLIKGCPVVFRSTDMDSYRTKFAHLLTTGGIPF